MKQTIKKWVLKNIPHSLLKVFFASKLSNRQFMNNNFIKVYDEIANRSFWMFLRSDTWIEGEFFEKGLYGKWEKVSLMVWAELSKKSNIIIDIGANTGCYSLLAKNNNPSAKVIAVEPVNVNHEILSKNINRNGFDIAAEKIALSDKEGTATMFMLKDRLNYMTSVNDDRYKLHPEIQGDTEVVPIEVPIKPFNYLVDKHKLKRVDLIKLDVEGHELAVLQSMQFALTSWHPIILIEVIGDDNAIHLNSFFKEIGYDSFYAVDEQNGIKEVDKLWDNDHANFLITTKKRSPIIPTQFIIK